MSQEEYAIIGKILRPLGIKGDLVCQTVDDRALFKHIKTVFYISDDGLSSLEIEWLGYHKSRSIIHIKGVDTRNSADSYRNKFILARISDLPKLLNDEYYEFQIVDKVVISIDGKEIGKVDYVIYTGGTDILSLSNNTLVPFCKDNIIEITDEFIRLKLVNIDTSDIV